MTEPEKRTSEYPHFVPTRLSDGLMEAVTTVRLKLDVNRSVAVRRMLTLGARAILGADWKPTGKK